MADRKLYPFFLHSRRPQNKKKESSKAASVKCDGGRVGKQCIVLLSDQFVLDGAIVALFIP